MKSRRKPGAANIPRDPRLAAPGDPKDGLDQLEFWLDRAFRLPGTDYRFGLDGILGLIPGVCDTVTAAVSSLLLVQAYRIGARKRVMTAMLKNILVDWILGSVPLVGDVFDFAHKANTKNLRLLRQERDRVTGREHPSAA